MKQLDHYDRVPVGATFSVGAQIFTMERIDEWGGKLTYLWSSKCAQCADDMLVVTPFRFDAVHRVCASCARAPVKRPGKRRGHVEREVMRVAEGLSALRGHIKLQDLLDLVAANMAIPAGRDTRAQVITRALHSLAREHERPLELVGAVVYFR